MAARKITKRVHIEDSLGRSYDREQLVNAPQALESVPKLTQPSASREAMLDPKPALSRGGGVETAYSNYRDRVSDVLAADGIIAMAFGRRNAAAEKVYALEGQVAECDKQIEAIRLSSPKEAYWKQMAVLEGTSREVLKDVEREATRIYGEHGASAREAQRLAKRIVEKASVSQEKPGSPSRTALVPVKFSVVRGKPETSEAAKSALTDPDYLAAANRANRIAESWQESSQDYARALNREWQQVQPIQEERDEAVKRLIAARKERSDANINVAKAKARVRVNAADDATEYAFDRSFQEDPENPTLVRNPDGTTNVWVWRQGETEHSGSYEKVIVVATTFDASGKRVNTLITALGEEVKAGEHYANGKRQWASSFDLLVEEPQSGAKALANEGNPTGGWFASTDSSG